MDVIKYLNNLKIVQTTEFAFSNMPKHIYSKYFENAKLVFTHTGVTSHPGKYETGIDVYLINDEFYIAVESIIKIYSEFNNYSTFNFILKFYEAKPVSRIVNYEIKK